MMADEQSREIATVEEPFSNIPATQQSRAVFLPANLAQAMELAKFMAGGIGVRQFMRGNPSACLAVIQISMRWGLDPYIVANKAYYTGDTLSFESQLVNAVINTCGELIGRLKVEFSGDATGGNGKETLNCVVTGRIKADPDQLFTHEQALATVKIRNSPLWAVNPKQQLQYHATRAWARLYLPEVLLGIYTPDEITDGIAQRIEEQSTPRDATPAPDRRTFEEEPAQEAEFEEIRTVLPEEESEDADGSLGSSAEQQTVADTKPAADVHSADAAGAGPGEPTVTESDLPVEPLEWATWKRETLADIAAATDVEGFNQIRKRIQPALDQADDDLLTAIQDALADKLTSLPETK
jgi:hypothetical protein